MSIFGIRFCNFRCILRRLDANKQSVKISRIGLIRVLFLSWFWLGQVRNSEFDFKCHFSFHFQIPVSRFQFNQRISVIFLTCLNEPAFNS